MAWYDNLFGTKAAPVSLPLDSPQLAQYLTSQNVAGQVVNKEQAMRLSTVYACVKILSETVSTLPCHLYRQVGDSKEMHSGAPLHDLMLRNPNEFMTAPEFYSYIMTCLLLQGNFFGYINRTSSGRVVEILPLQPENVTIRQDQQFNVIYEVQFANGKKDILDQNQILHIKNMTLDGVNGLSPIRYNSEALGSAIAARDYASNVFGNDATPRGILATDGMLSDDAYQNIRESWQASHQGVSNAHRIAILEQGLKFTPLSMSPADVQLLDSRKYSRTEVCAMFRVPPHMVADLDRATFSNIEHQDLQFYKSTILPYLTSIEARLNKSLLGVNTQHFKFDVGGLLRSDLTTRVNSYKELIACGVMSPNEARERLDMNPRDGGDEFITQTNNLQFGGNEPQAEEQQQEDE